ncbi:MAG: PP2C family protein-serine/threonine phosphatase [Candidatus Eisenbacteria bacterium]
MPILDPKSFYRKLDALLSKIQIVSGVKHGELISTVLRDLVEEFGQELSIRNGRAYEIVGNELVLCCDLKSPIARPRDFRLSMEYPPVRLLLEHRCYVFDAATPGMDPAFEVEVVGGTTSAAIVVGRDKEWVLAFGLAEGWERETIEFSLNAIRNALTYRLEHEWLAADLEETRTIQRSLFPDRIPEFPGYQIAARAETAEVVGGDFYDFLPLDEEVMGIAVGDASGHGLPAALLVRDVVTGLRMGVEKDMKITPALRKLNAVIHRSTLSTKFVSLFYGELERNGNLMYVNAGHNPPFLVLDRGVFTLDVGGSVLGPLPEIRFKRGFTHLDKGGILVVFSDGIIERANRKGEQFGEERLQDVLLESRHQPAQEILDAVFRAARDHTRARWEDDATVVVVRRLPSP